MNGAQSNDNRPPLRHPRDVPTKAPGPATHPVSSSTGPQPLLPRPAAIVRPPGSTPPVPLGRRRDLSGLTELLLALPWLWWSWLSVQFVGLPSTTLYIVALGAWGGCAFATLHPRAEGALAWKVFRLRPPNAIEAQQLGPAWFAVCTAAGVDPNRYRIWIHEGSEATAPATAGSTIAVTSWAVLVLPRRNLEAVLAHELAHRLALPRPVSLVIYGLSMPARLMGKAIVVGWKQPIFGLAIKLTIGFFLLGILGVWWAWGFTYYIVFMLSPLAAPFIVQWAARAAEKYADRVALGLGFGPALAEVFIGREYKRAQAWSSAPRQSLRASQPLDSARLRALERLMQAAPVSGNQPR